MPGPPPKAGLTPVERVCLAPCKQGAPRFCKTCSAEKKEVTENLNLDPKGCMLRAYSLPAEGSVSTSIHSGLQEGQASEAPLQGQRWAERSHHTQFPEASHTRDRPLPDSSSTGPGPVFPRSLLSDGSL